MGRRPTCNRNRPRPSPSSSIFLVFFENEDDDEDDMAKWADAPPQTFFSAIRQNV